MQIHHKTSCALLAAICVGAALPSCAFKRLANRDQVESAAANAKSLEEALAVLDAAIEETAPASEINSLPLNIPIHPESLESADADAAPIIETVSADEYDAATTDTLFALEGAEPTSLTEAAAAVVEVGPDPAAEEPKERERVVVRRPSPNYSLNARTTQAIDEFRTVRATAYSHTEADHIKYGELSAMGKPLRFGMVRSAAADWSRYPVGTRFRILGKPYEYVIDDYGSALVGTGTIDLYKPSDDRMDDWGVREIEIEIIAWGSFDKSLEILEPRREIGEHVEQMIQEISKKDESNALAGNGGDASVRSQD